MPSRAHSPCHRPLHPLIVEVMAARRHLSLPRIGRRWAYPGPMSRDGHRRFWTLPCSIQTLIVWSQAAPVW